MPLGDILIVCGAGYVSGKEMMSLELGQGLAAFGQPVSFVTSSWNDGDFLERLNRAGMSACILPIGFISATLTKDCLWMTAEQVLRWPGLLLGYRRLLQDQRPPKIIHTNWHHLLVLLPFLQPKRDLFWVHELLPDLPQYRRVFGWLEQRLGIFICVSHAVAESLRRIGIKERKIRVIYNGLSDPADSTGRQFPSNDRLRIGIVGQIGHWKGHGDLLRAMTLVQARYPHVGLHIFGKGESAHTAGLKRLCAVPQERAPTQWHDFVKDRREIYAGLDVCVVPSRTHDPLPTTAVEAGFFGLPVIATRRGGLPEIIEHEVNGLLVEAERPQEIAEAICRLIEDPSLRCRLGANARRMAVERFGRERFVNDFLALLDMKDSCA